MSKVYRSGMRETTLIALLVVGAVVGAVGWVALTGSAVSPVEARADQGDVATTTGLPRSTRNPSAPTTVAPSTTIATTTTELAAVRTDELFVSPAGTDRVDGGWTIDDPLRTPEFALSVAQLGDTINVLPGNYAPLTISGKSDLTLRAPFGGAVFSSGRYDASAGVLIENSTDVVVDGVQTETSLWGLRVFDSSNIVLRNNVVLDTGQEAIHVLNKSHDVRIESNFIDTTGQRPGVDGEFEFADFGEGIYLGTGGFLEGGVIDDVFNVEVIGNTVANTTAEAIEIKASVYNVTVTDNIVRDVDVHSGAAISIGRGERIYDANVLVERNIISNVSTRNPWADGIGVRVSSPATVRDNVIFDVQHFGIRVDQELRAVEGEVVLENNLIFGNGLDAVFNESQETGVPVSESGTIAGEEAQTFLEQLDQDAAAPEVLLLLEQLLLQ